MAKNVSFSFSRMSKKSPHAVCLFDFSLLMKEIAQYTIYIYTQAIKQIWKEAEITALTL